MSLRPKQIVFEEKWEELRVPLDAILNHKESSSKLSGMDMFQVVYNCCVSHPIPYPDRLYNALSKFLTQHVTSIVAQLQAHQSDLLLAYDSSWQKYHLAIQRLGVPFRFLNQQWVKKKREEFKNRNCSAEQASDAPLYVYELALRKWRVHVFDEIKPRLLHNIMETIERDRDGHQDVNLWVVQSVVESLTHLGNSSVVEASSQSSAESTKQVYKEEFESPFLVATQEYYRRKSRAYLEANDSTSYMEKAEELLIEEEKRTRRCLDQSSYDLVIKECEKELVEEHTGLINAEFTKMVQHGEKMIGHLSRMYRLLRRVPNGTTPMLAVLEAHVTQAGGVEIASIGQTPEPKQYVEKLLSVHSRYSALFASAFESDNAFIAALDKACRKIANDAVGISAKKTARAPEWLARYCDYLLKKSNREQSDHELEDKLKHVMVVFKYVDDKDVFQKFYSKMLAKRLIYGTSVSEEAESTMISLLKQTCGNEYTSKLQRMFTDMTVSKDINVGFKEFLTKSHTVSLSHDFSILVLQTGAWPLGAVAGTNQFVVPSVLQPPVAAFEQFYNQKHNGRKLTWLWHLSKGDLIVNFTKRRYEINATNFQMALLFFFNNEREMTMLELLKQTGLPESELMRTAKSLVTVKLLGVALENDTLSTNETDFPAQFRGDVTLRLNRAFTSNRVRLKISTAVQAETHVETEQTHKAIDDDRKLYVQAAIVRIMKARKVLQHVQLVDDVITQSKSRFSPSMPMIKKCIEHLIDKQFLERIEGTRDQYSYVACVNEREREL